MLGHDFNWKNFGASWCSLTQFTHLVKLCDSICDSTKFCESEFSALAAIKSHLVTQIACAVIQNLSSFETKTSGWNLLLSKTEICFLLFSEFQSVLSKGDILKNILYYLYVKETNCWHFLEVGKNLYQSLRGICTLKEIRNPSIKFSHFHKYFFIHPVVPHLGIYPEKIMKKLHTRFIQC